MASDDKTIKPDDVSPTMAKLLKRDSKKTLPLLRTKMKVSISLDLATVIQQRALEMGTTQSFVVETALRDRLGMRSLSDIKKVREHA